MEFTKNQEMAAVSFRIEMKHSLACGLI